MPCAPRSAPVSSSPARSSITGPRVHEIIAPRPSWCRGFADQSFHLPHRFAKSDEDGATHDRVTDMQLAHARQCRDRLNVEIIERVARIEAHAERANGCAGVVDLDQLRDDRRAFGIAPLAVES